MFFFCTYEDLELQDNIERIIACLYVCGETLAAVDQQQRCKAKTKIKTKLKPQNQHTNNLFLVSNDSDF